jgi:virginiamycin B lyase
VLAAGVLVAVVGLGVVGPVGSAVAGAGLTPVGTVTEFSTGITANSDPDGIAAGADGNMWFTESRSSKIGRITPTGKVTEFGTGITANSDPVGIAPGADGNMWFTQGDSALIGRITPTGKVTEFSTGITAHSDPYEIAPGADGNMEPVRSSV